MPDPVDFLEVPYTGSRRIRAGGFRGGMPMPGLASPELTPSAMDSTA